MPVCHITRSGYTRRTHHRRAYRRSDGTLVHATTVRRSRVEPARIVRRGNPNAPCHKGRKVIDLKKDVAHQLRRFGYSTKKRSDARQRALREAIEHWSSGTVKKRLVAIRTLNKWSNPGVANIVDRDVHFVDQIRAREGGHRPARSYYRPAPRRDIPPSRGTTRRYRHAR